jgi:quinoprotein glucose dehydrogenase
MNLFSRSLLVCALCGLVPGSAWAVPGEEAAPPPDAPQIAAASDEGEQAMRGFRIPEGMQVKLWAAEPDLANPVAFTVDAQGRVYVCETFRQSRGIEDNRGHEHWLDDDLAAQTVEDRLAYIRKHLGEKANDYSKYDDRVRQIQDTDGDGKADKATVFAERFNNIVDGTLAGVLARGNDVFVTCIPHLWRLRDTNGDGQADERDSLSYGYGVRFAFRGHDMHGLVLGPDGRLYFSIGDRGLNVKQGDRHFVNPEAGAVLRCELDGSNLEMFARGLRNPQELAFDDFGNLFTGDNNSDSGDRARWVHVVEGGDTGWRMAYQYLPDRGPWNREKLWHPHHDGQAAYIVPPITNFADGPSGLAFYPGTGLSDHFKDRFFLVDFRGGPANSGIRTFRNKAKGATFELVDAEETIWNVLATDVEFGPDGAIWLSDWINGWNGEGKGRLYKVHSDELAKSPIVQEVKLLLASDWSKKSVPDLVSLLAHPDRRVRLEAQFALVDAKAADALASVAKDNASLLARVHAIWGIEQLARRGGYPDEAMAAVLPLLADGDPEVRAQAAKVLGESRTAAAQEQLVERLADDSPRVRFFAAQSLGKLGQAGSIGPLLSLLEQNNDEDPVLRQGAIVGLVGASGGQAQPLVAEALHPSPAARLGLVVALRRLHAEEVAQFLNDADPRVVLEAAGAIHDEPIAGAMPALAALITRSSDDDALLRRVLNANYRAGSAEAALALATYAGRAEAPEAMRIEALQMLGAWAKPSGRDRVLGMWRPLAERNQSDAAAALKAHLASIFSGSGKVSIEAAAVATKLEMPEVAPILREMLADRNLAPRARADALAGLAVLRDGEVERLVRASLEDSAPDVRAAARSAMVQLSADEALPLLVAAAEQGERIERQTALADLGKLRGREASTALAALLDKLLAGQMPADVALDLVAAAGGRRGGDLRERLARYEAARPSGDQLAAWRECLEGGDAERGRKIFYERTQLSCVRCHKVAGTGGEVGPDLSKISTDKQRDYLLEAIVLPSKTIAKNFESAVILDLDGVTHTGVLKQETEKEVVLMTAEGKLVTVAKENIEARKPGKSAMPEDLTKYLTKFEMRDLIEFLAAQK